MPTFPRKIHLSLVDPFQNVKDRGRHCEQKRARRDRECKSFEVDFFEMKLQLATNTHSEVLMLKL